MKLQKLKADIAKFINFRTAGLGIWNSYFLFKFGLYYFSYIHLDILLNIIMAALLTVHLGSRLFHDCWRLFLGVLALALLYHDSYLPGVEQILTQQRQLEEMSLDYILNFLWDFISFPMIFAFLGVMLLSWFLKSYLRVTTVVFLTLFALSFFDVWITGPSDAEKAATLMAAAQTCAPAGGGGAPGSGDIPPMTDSPTDKNLEKYVTRFFAREAFRKTVLPGRLSADFAPFDIVLMNICSLSRDDIRQTRLEDHPLFNKFDVSFEHFNGATSYSVPASLRLLRSSCGQETEAEMYKGRRQECELLNNLAALGFTTSVYLDHNGVYGEYLSSLQTLAGLSGEPEDPELLRIAYRSFDGTPVYSDAALFEQYLNSVSRNSSYGNAAFFNLISLHDGLHNDGERRSLDFEPRLRRLLDDLSAFADQLEKSGRNVLFIMVPEHGGAIAGDKMQFAKLREIPTDRITELPVYVRFFGKQHQESQIKLQGRHSYLALSELIARSIKENVYADPDSNNLDPLTRNLPETAPVSESTNAFFIKYGDKGFYKIKGGSWTPYVY